MAQNRQRRKKSASPETATERAARLSARIGGRYAVAAAVAGAVVAAVLTAALTNGFGLLEGAKVDGTESSVPVKYSGLPVRIDLVMLDESQRTTESYVFPQKLVLTASELQKLNRLSPGPLYDNWFHSRGGVDPDVSVVKLVVAGNRPYHVQIINMGIIDRCGPPLAGTLFSNAPAGGIEAVPGINFDLDLPRPFPQNGDLTGSWFQQHTVDLGPGESQTLEVVSSSTRYCSYSITLTVVNGTNTVSETVTNHGKPFQVSGLLQSPAHYQVLYVGGTKPGAFAPFVRKDPSQN